MAYDDYEQSEQVRQWVRENAMAIVGGIALGLLLIFGAQQWRSHQARHRAGAANAYHELQQAMATGNQTEIDRLAASLRDEYKDTAFSVLAQLGAANRALEAGNLEEAAWALAWAEQHSDSDALRSLAGLRKARVQVAQNDPQGALAQLDRLPAEAYKGLVEELRGDALAALDRTADARAAYAAALKANGESAPQNRLLQLKLDNLASAEAELAVAATTATAATASVVPAAVPPAETPAATGTTES